MERTIFEGEHQLFRQSFQTFVEREVAPHYERWEREGAVERALWAKAGAAGFLSLGVPEEDGGSGIDDFRYNAIVSEELSRRFFMGVGFAIHTDLVIPYLVHQARGEQRARWLPRIASGELIGAIAMTEPAAGSDLAGIRTTARREGDCYMLSGQKTFISNGINSDLVIVVARTDPAAGHRGISLLVVERGMPGFSRGRNLEKIGQHSQDTAELFFDEVPVPVANLLGEEGRGFAYLMAELPQERLTIAVSALAAAEAAFELTVAYCAERQAFGRPIGDFQHTRFLLAELKTELTIGRVFVDRCIEAHLAGRLTTEEASMAKWWATELQNRVMDRGLQLHGGYGYMREYPIARAFLDARVQTIYGGTTEIMKEIIGRSLFPRRDQR
ncbi:MAG TPA: acyl-CoA dehydrogenase family protein [Chloroflexaceae bacterium]|nr:acyl-CoA dehydrogenase family protein [Chloroflexaceae bacterium]